MSSGVGKKKRNSTSGKEASKSKTLLFAGSVSKKGNATPRPRWFYVGFNGLKAKLCFAFKPKLLLSPDHHATRYNAAPPS
jgi:hypothetical protein